MKFWMLMGVFLGLKEAMAGLLDTSSMPVQLQMVKSVALSAGPMAGLDEAMAQCGFTLSGVSSTLLVTFRPADAALLSEGYAALLSEGYGLVQSRIDSERFFARFLDGKFRMISNTSYEVTSMPSNSADSVSLLVSNYGYGEHCLSYRARFAVRNPHELLQNATLAFESRHATAIVVGAGGELLVYETESDCVLADHPSSLSTDELSSLEKTFCTHTLERMRESELQLEFCLGLRSMQGEPLEDCRGKKYLPMNLL